MSEVVVPVHLSGPLFQAASDQAERNGISLEDWLRSIAAAAVRDAYISEKYFLRKARAGDASELLAILDVAPDVPPMPGDELLGASEQAQNFFRARASRARKGALRAALDAVPDREADPGDELEA